MPAKMIVVNLSQGTDEWLKWRSGGITATDIIIILGLSPHKTRWQLWAEKVGRINAPDISKNPNVIRGNRLEDDIRLLAEDRYGDILLPICGEFGEWPILRASFDGLDTALKPYEFKAPADSTYETLEQEGVNASTYKMYEAQVHAQCVVAGKREGQLIFYKEDGKDLDFTVTLTNEYAEHIINEAKIFWQMVVKKKPPALDPERDWFIPEKGETCFIWETKVGAWCMNNHRINTLKAELIALQQAQEPLQKEIIQLMGPYYQADIGGVKVSRFTKQGGIDYKEFLKDKFPGQDLSDELESYRKLSREETRFTRSSDELVNREEGEVITSVKAAYF
ncbi:lambda-exonuclease family protein [Alkalimarinus alittae]|uniref:YqaJ viral recombinase family protein n=1 Tax=Alkalimarinus alittae TaxID=2961619 RepID=A0ABY6N551_9ALTE|nr:YqaJ viral recombinase family protein [Alkalimarinus alittae]UZE97258.1 YqaJ viral recombinase family protein [Alkalimarinus alittae]